MKKYFILIIVLPILILNLIIGFLILMLDLILVSICFLSGDKFMKQYSINVILSTDQKINALMAGDEDETISSRAGRVWPESDWCKLIDLIMFWQTDHCHRAIEKGEGKRDLLFPVQ